MNRNQFKLFLGILLFFWCLTPKASITYIIFTFCLAIIIVWYFSSISNKYMQSRGEIRLVQLIKYIFWLIKEIAIASLQVIKVIFGINKLNPNITTIKSGEDKLGQVIYANSITLTPGTLTIEVNQNELRVHSLNKGLEKDLVKSNMLRKINRIIND